MILPQRTACPWQHTSPDTGGGGEINISFMSTYTQTHLTSRTTKINYSICQLRKTCWWQFSQVFFMLHVKNKESLQAFGQNDTDLYWHKTVLPLIRVAITFEVPSCFSSEHDHLTLLKSQNMTSQVGEISHSTKIGHVARKVFIFFVCNIFCDIQWVWTSFWQCYKWQTQRGSSFESFTD